MPTQFGTHLKEVLRQIRITDPVVQPLRGSNWNAGELALVKVTVTNSTGFFLRRVVVETSLDAWDQTRAEYSFYEDPSWKRKPHVDPTLPKHGTEPALDVGQGSPVWKGNGAPIGDLEPDEVWEGDVACLRAKMAGDITPHIRVRAEVVPYGVSPDLKDVSVTILRNVVD